MARKRISASAGNRTPNPQSSSLLYSHYTKMSVTPFYMSGGFLHAEDRIRFQDSSCGIWGEKSQNESRYSLSYFGPRQLSFHKRFSVLHLSPGGRKIGLPHATVLQWKKSKIVANSEWQDVKTRSWNFTASVLYRRGATEMATDSWAGVLQAWSNRTGHGQPSGGATGVEQQNCSRTAERGCYRRGATELVTDGWVGVLQAWSNRTGHGQLSGGATGVEQQNWSRTTLSKVLFI
jgi:hypothetical protein